MADRRNCIVPIPVDSDFTLENLPYGIFQKNGEAPRAGVAIGDHILDLFALAEAKHLDAEPGIFSQSSLNAFISLGKNAHQNTRKKIKSLLTGELENAERFLVHQAEAEMLLPVRAGDYTDFYSCRYHAERVGKMFRKNQEPLLPNWLHMPIAYHGRASSLIPSRQAVKRPQGQFLDGEKVVFGPTKALDYELEMAFCIEKIQR